MAQDNKIYMPGNFGGIVRYDEEYKSNFMLSPVAVIAYVILVLVFVVALKIFFPVGA